MIIKTNTVTMAKAWSEDVTGNEFMLRTLTAALSSRKEIRNTVHSNADTRFSATVEIKMPQWLKAKLIDVCAKNCIQPDEFVAKALQNK